MDTFIEILVKKQKQPKDILKTVGVVLLAIILILANSVFVAPFAPSVAPIIMVAIIIGAGYLITSSKIEYEYVLTNGEIDIDKIVAQRKRTRVVTFDCKGIVEFGKYSNAINPKNFKTFIDASENHKNDNTYYVIIDHTKFGRTLVLFTPGEVLLEKMRPYLPRIMQSNI